MAAQPRQSFARSRLPADRLPRHKAGMIILSDEFADLDVSWSGQDGIMRTHLFRPAIDGRYPGVLLFSEIYQVTAPIRRLAAFIAGHGYCVAVPEVYHEYEARG